MKMTMAMLSSARNTSPNRAMMAGDVSMPMTMALMMITARIMFWKRADSTHLRSRSTTGRSHFPID